MFVRGLIIHTHFVHRINDNSTVDSICLHCFATVASLPKEMDLEQKENAHSCWQHVQQTSAAHSGRENRNPVTFLGQSLTP
jgi:hypothetical protein